MNIDVYLTKLQSCSKTIFDQSLAFKSELGKAHHLSSCIYEFSDQIHDSTEKDVLVIVCSQLESSTLNATMGLYRQAFSSLRLAFELGLGEVYFSVHRLDFEEWLDNRADIKWSDLIDDNRGVFSKRFVNAFFKELSEIAPDYRTKACKTYRSLSEFVHGNSETWIKSGLEISYKEDLLVSYFGYFSDVVEIILLALTCRYAKSLAAESRESLQFILEELSHVSQIRELFGGPKV